MNAGMQELGMEQGTAGKDHHLASVVSATWRFLLRDVVVDLLESESEPDLLGAKSQRQKEQLAMLLPNRKLDK